MPYSHINKIHNSTVTSTISTAGYTVRACTTTLVTVYRVYVLTSLHCITRLLHYSLKPLDIEFMKRLDHCVNIVPVIAKSDTLTIDEREAFKQRVGYTILLVVYV